MIFFDTETVGLHGLPIIIQYAIDNGPIILHNFWTNPIRDSLELIEIIVNHKEGIVGFNLTFDWFHLCKVYNVFSLYHDHDELPENIIEELAELEMQARDGVCLKPVTACDLMLVARKTKYQSTMDRKDVRIKRVPTQLSWQLAAELEKRIPLNDIYFARRADKTADKWNVYDLTDDEGKLDVNFKDIVLKFAPSVALKALAVDALGIKEDDILKFTTVEVDRRFRPVELGYAPFAKAVGEKGWWRGAWPEVIHHHIRHWEYNQLARKYASKDVEYTRALYYHFNSPKLGDNDSILACMVASVRWRGFKVDIEKLKELKNKAIEASKAAPTAPSYVKKYIYPHLSPEEKLVTKGSTKKVILEKLLKESMDECEECIGEKCEKCKGTGEVQTEAGKRAKAVLAARTAQKEIELYNKLILSGRFHASFKIIGALSGRMSGSDGLNPQGIKATKDVRRAFILAWQEFKLLGGDFKSFEVCIADSIYDDPKLRSALLTCSQCKHIWDIEDQDKIECPGCGAYQIDCECKAICVGYGDKVECKRCKNFKPKTGIKEDARKKIHGLFAEVLFPEENYEGIVASKGTEHDLYTDGKKGVFSQLYGGNEATLVDRLGLSDDIALAAKDRWLFEYPGIKKAQRKIEKAFQSMVQPGGIGTRVMWNTPDDKVESVLGFPRYFTLENQICHALFQLAEKPPKSWQEIKVKVVRRDREQLITGAVRSALFAAAFAIQSANVRAAINHVIQSTGAEITKILQRRLWDLQPSGIHEFLLMLLNVHDEIMCPAKPEMQEKINKIVEDLVTEFRPLIPLIGIDWSNKLETWADK